MKTCSICGSKFDEFGNNPQPFDGETCCNDCDDRFVIPARILLGRGMDPNHPAVELLHKVAGLGRSLAVSRRAALKLYHRNHPEVPIDEHVLKAE